MNFRFRITLTEGDYVRFNEFHAVRSKHGKKQLKNMLLMIGAIFVIFLILTYLQYGISTDALIVVAPVMLVLALFAVFVKKFMLFILRREIAALKKRGKLAYSPFALLEFYDDYYVETTDTARLEQKYSAFERIVIVEGDSLYLYVTNISAQIIPLRAFGSKEQYDAFILFLKSKCDTVEVYK